MIISQTDSELQQKQIVLHKAIAAEADSSESDNEDESDFGGEQEDGEEEFMGQITDKIATARTNNVNSKGNSDGEEEEKKAAAGGTNNDNLSDSFATSSSFRSDFSSVRQKSAIDKPTCLLILKQVISIKRE